LLTFLGKLLVTFSRKCLDSGGFFEHLMLLLDSLDFPFSPRLSWRRHDAGMSSQYSDESRAVMFLTENRFSRSLP
jgi:hypothetical protein